MRLGPMLEVLEQLDLENRSDAELRTLELAVRAELQDRRVLRVDESDVHRRISASRGAVP